MENKKLLLVLGALISVTVVIVIVLILRGLGGGGVNNAYIEFWGTFDSPVVYEAIIRDFEAQHQGAKIVYRQFPYEEYEQKLLNSLAAGTGPDLYMIHNTWLPKHGDKLKPLPEKIDDLKEPLLTVQNLKRDYVDVVFNDFVYSNQIYALPLYVDTLALYYNKDLFNTAGITGPPQTWEEFNRDVELLTKLNSAGDILQSGAAMGTARNINRSTDILQALMIQSGVPMTNADKTQAIFERSAQSLDIGERTLQFFTDFANPATRVYAWNDRLHYSVDSFIEGSLAMMLNYSHQADIIKSKNSRLNFAIAPMPQASLTDIKNFANYWGVGVANKSQNSDLAWQFAAYLTSKEGATQYLNNTGRPSARRDLIDLQRSDDDVGVFAVQSLTAKSWYQVDNVAIEKIFADMIEDIYYRRSSIKEALRNAETKVNVLMQK
ncbi:MAG: hypothetical protein A3G02_01900 [Candidatus Yanofskybacteria bacterium RIFCSPLOWO2_12_FULL_44_13b]|nr:MAG: hypothetical protein A3G02_01900 [Candidatus Yanofskybacteria bacterium RIFCSPLOWO2_12_FULL_44_13b]